VSNGIILDEARDWIVAGWAACNAVDAIIPKLQGPFADEIAARLRVVHDWSGALADFRGASPEQIAVLAAAAHAALAEAVAHGSAGWQNPSFFPGYIERFRELVTLLDIHTAAIRERGA